jgi:urease accessory protein
MMSSRGSRARCSSLRLGVIDSLPPAALPDPSWAIGKHALLILRALRRRGRTEVNPILRRIPYQWLGYVFQDHDDQPFVLLHNSAGGFVEGDAAELRVLAEPGTRSLFTTTAATKFYKCEAAETSCDRVSFSVGEGALLEYLPDEAIPFAMSHIDRTTRFTLHPSSRFFASDVISAGRVSYRTGEVFAFAAMRSQFEVRIDGRVVVLDRLVACEPGDVVALSHLWGGHSHSATVAAYAPSLPRSLIEQVHERCHALAGRCQAGVTVVDGVIVVRVLADRVWQAHEAVYQIWEAVRPVIAGKRAHPIWKP